MSRWRAVSAERVPWIALRNRDKISASSLRVLAQVYRTTEGVPYDTSRSCYTPSVRNWSRELRFKGAMTIEMDERVTISRWRDEFRGACAEAVSADAQSVRREARMRPRQRRYARRAVHLPDWTKEGRCSAGSRWLLEARARRSIGISLAAKEEGGDPSRSWACSSIKTAETLLLDRVRSPGPRSEVRARSSDE